MHTRRLRALPAFTFLMTAFLTACGGGGSGSAAPSSSSISTDVVAPAEPTWVAGTAAYSDGGWTYTDYVYDDTGAGGYTYPAGAEFNENAADGVLFSVVPGKDAIHYSLRLSTLIVPDSTVFAVAVDTDPGAETGGGEWPYNAKLSSDGWEFVITAWGAGAVLVDAAGNETPLEAAVDVVRNTLTVSVPKDLYDPEQSTWRLRAAVGLWDARLRQWAEVLPDSFDGNSPSGKRDASLPNAFNLLFRNTEFDGGSLATDETASGGFQTARQEAALNSGDIAAFYRDVDFDLIKRGATVEPAYPQTDIQITRLYESAAQATAYLEGRNLPPLGQTSSRRLYNGLFQPYILFVPGTYWDSDAPAPLVPMLHGWLGNHRGFNPGANAYWDMAREQRLLVPKVLGRGEEVWYEHLGELDTLEVIADMRRHYRIDDDRIFLAGTSMGGLGTLKVATGHPDLFAGIYPSVPPISDRTHGYVIPESNEWDLSLVADSLRHVPTLVFIGTIDGLVPAGIDPDRFCDRLEELRYDHDCWRDLLGQHASYDVPRAAEIGDLIRNHSLVRNPAEVVYASEEAFRRQAAEAGIADLLRYDSAYWVFDIRYPDPVVDPEIPPREPVDTSLRREPVDGGVVRRLTEGNRISRVRVFSEGIGDGEPVETIIEDDPSPTLVRRGIELGAHQAIPKRNAFALDVQLVNALSLDLERAGLQLRDLEGELTGDGPVQLTLQASRGNARCEATLDDAPVTATTEGRALTLALDLNDTPAALQISCGG